jgi:hypothetical protein
MVIEHYKDAAAVYHRFRECGRMAPDGLRYVSSWVDENLERCYQLMETGDSGLLDEWMANWNDIVEFEVRAVVTSEEAARRISDGVQMMPQASDRSGTAGVRPK